ncbi:MAG: peptidoglycan bridge formation glycyltransferase FemA/FemB family protein [Anaerolineaceae bacterium]|nr:peptidoglycan bridge formation glycyltransferase FemA/FemB family protein [Anaerolineaceae bacterium]
MTNNPQWNTDLSHMPEPHLLQTEEWASIKTQYGWRNIQKSWRDVNGKTVAMANILLKNIKIGPLRFKYNLMYIPRGPILDWNDVELRQRVLKDIILIAKENKSFLIKIDPEVIIGKGIPETNKAAPNTNGINFLNELKQQGWHYSQDQIQFKNTVWLDLSLTEDELLANMKQKTRYNIRLSGKKGVTISEGKPSDFTMLANMYAQTAIRDKFTIRSEKYYLKVWSHFYNQGKFTPLIAFYEDEPIAALMLFHFAGRAWYIHGMSRSIHRNKMASYLLQWEAIKVAKSKDCNRYDLWGAPFDLIESDPMRGVYRFKQGFAGETIRTIGAWDFPIKPLLHHLYIKVMPIILNIMRKIGNRKTRKKVTSNSDFS